MSWWYGDGFIGRVQMVKKRLARLADVFSIEILIKTLFNPFRQISAGKTSGPFVDQVRAFFDKLFSRFIGASVRLIVISIGLVSLTIATLFAIVFLTLWIIVPIIPILGLIMLVIGWVPQWKM